MPNFPRTCLSHLVSLYVASAFVSSATANPLNGQVVAGQAQIEGEGTNQVTVTQRSSRAVLNWESFSVGAHETTTFVQPSTASVTANRIRGRIPRKSWVSWKPMVGLSL